LATDETREIIKVETMTNFASQKMTMTVLEQVLEVYGADLNRMPDGLADNVKAFIETSERGHGLFQEAASIDGLLNNHNSMPDFDFNTLETSIASSLDAPLTEARLTEDLQGGKLNEAASVASADIIDFKDKGLLQTDLAAKTSAFKSSQWFSRGDASKKMSTPVNDNGGMLTFGLLAASLFVGVFFGSLGVGSYLFDDSGVLSIASTSMTDDIFYISEDFNLAGNLIAGIE